MPTPLPDPGGAKTVQVAQPALVQRATPPVFGTQCLNLVFAVPLQEEYCCHGGHGLDYRAHGESPFGEALHLSPLELLPSP